MANFTELVGIVIAYIAERRPRKRR